MSTTDITTALTAYGYQIEDPNAWLASLVTDLNLTVDTMILAAANAGTAQVVRILLVAEAARQASDDAHRRYIDAPINSDAESLARGELDHAQGKLTAVRQILVQFTEEWEAGLR